MHVHVHYHIACREFAAWQIPATHATVSTTQVNHLRRGHGWVRSRNDASLVMGPMTRGERLDTLDIALQEGGTRREMYHLKWNFARLAVPTTNTTRSTTIPAAHP